MNKHRLKTLPEFFYALHSNAKTFELRRNDRDFRVGDLLYLERWTPMGGFTGSVIIKRVSYVLEDFEGLLPGYCILGLESGHGHQKET